MKSNAVSLRLPPLREGQGEGENVIELQTVISPPPRTPPAGGGEFFT